MHSTIRFCSIAILALLLASLLEAQGSSTRYPGSGSDYPSRDGLLVRDLVKVRVTGIHVNAEEIQSTRVAGLKVIPSVLFKVDRAVDQKGKELPEWNGVTVRYVESKKTKDLVAKNHEGQELIIRGRLDSKLRVLEVESVEAVPMNAATKDSEPAPKNPEQTAEKQED